MAGGFFRDDDDLPEAHEINVTPFIDVMLVLLIIFMVAAPLATVDVAVDLPASNAPPAARPEAPLWLTVGPDLSLRLGEAARLTRIRATCLLTIEPRAQPAILGRLKALPAVERVHSTSGRVDLLLQLACGSTVELDEVLDQIGNLTGVRSSESLVHLSTKFDRSV